MATHENRSEIASGLVLLAAAAVALAWANAPFGASYAALWRTPLGVKLGWFAFQRDLGFWINDGLMTIFFFVVGLELRVELHDGTLSDRRRAALPAAAALGGMLVPAAIFLALNARGGAPRGWGLPVATDIAFAVGALALLGRRMPPAVRVLLLALAVVDDLGAILVIGFVYSSGFAVTGLLAMMAGVAAVVLLRATGVRSPWAYVGPGVALWGAAYAAGVHPTLAGVLLGLLTPPRPQAAALERALGGVVAFGIMPLFALANAGVHLGGLTFAGAPLRVFLGAALGLVVGKPLGILAGSWLGVRLGLAALPAEVTWPEVAVVGLAGGIGFTMALFIAALAFPGGALLETAKLAVLAASATAGSLAFAVGRLVLRRMR
jgi:NhaA family Na+:H+ antiporter